MQLVILCLSAVAIAAPTYEKEEVVPILRDDRVQEDSHYSFDIETGDGIVRSEAGQPVGEAGAVNKQGQIA